MGPIAVQVHDESVLEIILELGGVRGCAKGVDSK